MKIGNKIKELRKKRGLTQEQLAGSIGVSFQAVSKWENNIALPDITLAPVLAGFFGVSMDELFCYSTDKIMEEALNIAKSTWDLRETDPAAGIKIIEEGLKQYPDNDILLQNLLYLINCNEEPDKTIEVAAKVIDVTSDSATKYDALRFLAYAYKAKGDTLSARSALDQIPEIYFSKMSEMAYVLTGEEKMNAAKVQETLSLEQLLEMQTRIAECLTEKGDKEGALRKYEQGARVLEILTAPDSDYWKPYASFFKEKIEQLNA